MLPLPAFLAPSAVYVRLLNALLRREEWARDKLAAHSGKAVRLIVGKLQASLLIQYDGLVVAADPLVVPDVVLTFPADKLSQLPAALQARDPSRIAALMHIQGDAGLATVVSDLAKDLRWDAEQDLSRVVGDIGAMRLLGAGRYVLDGTRLAATRLGANVAEYISEESGLMATRHAYQEWQARIHLAQQQLDALDDRVSALTQRHPVSGSGVRS